MILEEDPDKPVKVVNEKVDNDSDDLLVVSEKGQVLKPIPFLNLLIYIESKCST